MRLLKVTLAFLSFIFLLSSCESGSTEQSQNSPTESSSTANNYLGEDWTLTNLAGEAVTLSDFQGRPTLLVFWATWCPYCKKLLPGIARLNDKYEAQGLKVLAVNIKEDWKPEVYWRNHEYQFDTVLDGDEIAKKYGISGTPGLVFIAPSGQILGVQQFSDPEHPLLERFAQEGIKLMKEYQADNPKR